MKELLQKVFSSRQRFLASRILLRFHGLVMSKVTIYDVADRSGVSIATVSRVPLNSPHRVNDATRQRVLESIDALGYVPKAEATARARKVNNRIGVLAPFFTYPSFVQRLRGVSDVLAGASYELVIYNVESAQNLRSYLESLPISRRLDGLILMSVVVDDRTVERLLSHELQTVAIEVSYPSLSGVEIDNESGGRLVAEYLLAKGHRFLAFVGGDVEVPGCTLKTSKLRLAGFKTALHVAGVALPDVYIKQGDLRLESVQPQVDALFALERPPTAIFAASDSLALIVLQAVRAWWLART